MTQVDANEQLFNLTGKERKILERKRHTCSLLKHYLVQLYLCDEFKDSKS